MSAGWMQTHVGDLLTLAYGKSLPKKARKPGAYPVYGSNGVVGTHVEPAVSGPGIIVGRKGSCGEVHYCGSDFWPIDTTYYVELNEEASLRFTSYLLQSLGLKEMNSHSTIPGLNRERAYRLPISLPPLPEQKKIAAVLLKIQRAIEVQDKIISSLHDLKKSTMQQLFTHGLRGEKTKMTDIGEIPESWGVRSISDICTERPQNGIFIKNPVWGEGYRYLNVADVYKQLVVRVDSLQSVAYSKDASQLSCLKPGDVLFVRSSLKREGVGRCCVYMERDHVTLFDCHLIRVRLEISQMNPIYFASYWITTVGQNELIRRSKTTTMTTINQKSLVGALIPCPSKEEQDAIAETYESLQKRFDIHQSQKASLQALFKTTLNKLMTGDIRVDSLDVDVKEVEV